jgi:hypothetical protein
LNLERCQRQVILEREYSANTVINLCFPKVDIN